jgi:hypothetical protein
MDAADYWNMIDAARARQAWNAVERAMLTQCCEHCGAALHHKGFSAGRGRAVTLTTCPRCDRYDERTDR